MIFAFNWYTYFWNMYTDIHIFEIFWYTYFFHSWSSKFFSAIISLLPEELSLTFLLKHVCLWWIIFAFLHRECLFLPLFLKDIFPEYKTLGSGLTILFLFFFKLFCAIAFWPSWLLMRNSQSFKLFPYINVSFFSDYFQDFFLCLCISVVWLWRI